MTEFELVDDIFLDSKQLHQQLDAILLPHLFETGLTQLITEYSQWFIRSEHEKARCIQCSLDGENKNQLKVGDIIVHVSRKGVRKFGVSCQTTFDDLKTQKLVTNSDNDYLFIPESMTRWIENPITFYSAASRLLHYKIELDARYHQRLLQNATGGRSIGFQHQVYFSRGHIRLLYRHPDTQMCVSIPLTPQTDFSLYGFSLK